MSSSRKIKKAVEIKGIGDHLALIIHEALPFDQLVNDVRHLINQESAKHFLHGSRIILKSDAKRLSSEEFVMLRDLLSAEGKMELNLSIPPQKTSVAPPLQSEDQASAEKKETPVISGTMLEKQTPSTDEITQGLVLEDALIVRQTLRSGQKIRTSRNVILLGDINPGAEIISAQNIWVYGTIRGLVHAGSEGNEKSTIMGLRLMSGQVRIAHLLAGHHQLREFIGPEIVFVENGEILFDLYPKLR
ncbi:MAG: septum site-determining protein MinC [SAR324 cluster bacterium]|nr:septum site-determining protein MinC [SAR324 cluster bacterium]